MQKTFNSYLIIIQIKHLFVINIFQSEATRRYRAHIPAPRAPLPGHAESYNPPPEYLFTKEEVRLCHLFHISMNLHTLACFNHFVQC
jgi:hypothetical protein